MFKYLTRLLAQSPTFSRIAGAYATLEGRKPKMSRPLLSTPITSYRPTYIITILTATWLTQKSKRSITDPLNTLSSTSPSLAAFSLRPTDHVSYTAASANKQR